MNESNYETPKPSKKTIIHPGGHYEIIDMANNKTSTPKKKTDEEEKYNQTISENQQNSPPIE